MKTNDSEFKEMSGDEYRAQEGARLMRGLREAVDEWKQAVRDCWNQDNKQSNAN